MVVSPQMIANRSISVFRTCITLVGLLGLVGCGEPVDSRVEPPSLAMPDPSTIVKPVEATAKSDDADFKNVKPRSPDDPVAVSFRVPSDALWAGDTFEVSKTGAIQRLFAPNCQMVTWSTPVKLRLQGKSA